MNSDPASLDNLQDIVEPAAVSWWPPAVGWWILLGCLWLVAVIGLIRGIRRWRADAYRRAALAELETAESSAEISEILKRTALVAFPRTDVASLSGHAWCQWLASTSGIQPSEDVQRSLNEGVFGGPGPNNHTSLREFASRWILRHGASEGGKQ